MKEKNNNNNRSKRNGTKTSAFGSPGRFGHDSSQFYASRLYEDIAVGSKVEYIENSITVESTNKIFCKSSESMDELPDSCVHLMVTSPPYNVGREYGQEYKNYLD